MLGPNSTQLLLPGSKKRFAAPAAASASGACIDHVERTIAAANESGLLILPSPKKRRCRRLCGRFLAKQLTAGKADSGFLPTSGPIRLTLWRASHASGVVRASRRSRRHGSAIKIFDEEAGRAATLERFGRHAGGHA